MTEKVEEEYYYYDEDEPGAEFQQTTELAESVLQQTTSQVGSAEGSMASKSKKKSKKVEVETLQVDQQYVLAALKEFIELNQSL